MFSDSVLYVHKCLSFWWADASRILFQATECSEVNRAYSTCKTKRWWWESKSNNLCPLPPKEVKKSPKQNEYEVVCTQRMGEQRSKASTQNLKVKHYFAAYQRATWRILSGSQMPNAKQHLKKIEKAGWGRFKHSV